MRGQWHQWFVLSVCLATAAASVRADELAERGRELLSKHQHAVVTIEMVLKMKVSLPGMGSEANEHKQDLTGTVVDPSGLTVLSLSACEPGELMQTMMAGVPGMSEEDAKVKFDTEITDLKMLLDDGTEMPADIVLRDKELDLAFIRPKSKPSAPMPCLDLSQSARVQVLDQVITLNRLGEAAGRSYAAAVERVCAVVRKPRSFYIPSSEMSATTLGSPAFTLEGKVLGLFVVRSVGQKGSVLGMLSLGPEALTPIILPAEDVLKAAKQALETKTGNDRKDEAKASKEPTGDKEKQ